MYSGYILDYLIRKLISYLEKTYGLCNLKTNHTFKKKYELHNPKVNLISRKDLQII